ncbi:carbonic anhydrase [Edaphobacter bradus]|uniref:carbonic anhydrase n=1 Tax=Edaphobacter bradus TaxID=2259016 RepID=UPI0021E0A524|nr:carbonic anhydrase [Edaphobacter bradus]
MQSTTRRRFLLTTSAALATTTLRNTPAFAAPRATPAPSPDEVLRLLQEGNGRFVAGAITHPGRTPADFKPLAAGQAPIATIIGCADSRVPPEILFDLGVGDLFVVRVAGNYVSGAGASVKGSVEYAVAELGVSLILVLGHSQCGAVKAAIQHLHDKDALPGAINDLVNTIKPAVLESEHLPGDPLDNAIRANVRRGVERLNTLQPVIAPAIKSGKLKVAGAVYDLSTGKVEVL